MPSDARAGVQRARGRRRPPFAGWFALAALFHAAGLALIGIGRLPSPASPPSAALESVETSIGLEGIGAGAFAAAWSVQQDEADSEPTEPQSPTPSRATRPRAAAGTRGQRPHVEAPPASPEPLEGNVATEPPPVPESVPRPLSLDALGVAPVAGAHNPFLVPSGPQRPRPRPPAPVRGVERDALNRRIEHVLRSGLAEHDQRIGLGPEGPVVAAVQELVQLSTTRPNTSALLELRTDAAGHTLYVSVLDANNDTDGWNAIARELERVLASKPLRVPVGSGGVTLQLRVVSRSQLPSGADPGLAVELFGQKIKKGEGDRSTTISILSPKVAIAQAEIPYTDGSSMPMLGFVPNLFGVVGDLTDIGAAARRVVHSYLVALETHPPDPAKEIVAVPPRPGP